jgi:ABC-type branched-subunit amino acid transport system substrate-binding protein
MKKKIVTVIFLVMAFLGSKNTYAQNDTAGSQPVYRVGIFAPLYLDSVFSKNTFKYKQGIPRFIAPAVDFVQGALVALDSLQDGDDYINASIFDTKSYTEKLSDLIKNKKLDSLSLIIGNVRDDDFQDLAAFAAEKNIPFISATYPNVAGIKANPYLVVMNSTLKSHCDAIYSYILQNHGTDKIYLCRQKGKQEDMVASYFKMMNEQDGKQLLQIETLNMDDNVTTAFLKSKLDSNSKSVIIGGSLDETFAGELAKACYDLYKSYSISLIGMPNWDNFSAMYSKKSMAGFPIYFTTPFYTDKYDKFSTWLTTAYQKKYKVKPSDMAYKGFESVYLFTKLLTKNSGNLMGHIADKGQKVFCDYNFKPVKQNDKAAVPDYFENKHLYLIKILNGSISKAW